MALWVLYGSVVLAVAMGSAATLVEIRTGGVGAVPEFVGIINAVPPFAVLNSAGVRARAK